MPCQHLRMQRNPRSRSFHPRTKSDEGPTNSTSGEVINPVRHWTTGSKLKKSSCKMKPSTKRPLRCSVSPDPPRCRISMIRGRSGLTPWSNAHCAAGSSEVGTGSRSEERRRKSILPSPGRGIPELGPPWSRRRPGAILGLHGDSGSSHSVIVLAYRLSRK
jgi:hypothetical protein